MSDAFLAWQQFSKESPTFPIGRIIDGGCTSTLDDEWSPRMTPFRRRLQAAHGSSDPGADHAR